MIQFDFTTFYKFKGQKKVRDSIFLKQFLLEKNYNFFFCIFYFSERPSLIEGWKVEKIQEIYLEALKSYVDNRPKPRPPTIFAKLLSVLTELRTLGNQNSEMCISFKLQNKKLPPFLAEIWDVNA